jgi:hypothetical protein
MRRFLVLIVVLALLAVVADRAAWWFAQQSIAAEIQRAGKLSTQPKVTVGGFPFVTQALQGNYKQIDAKLRNPDVDGGLTIDTLDIQLRGVRVSISDLINRRVEAVPVDEAAAIATISFVALNAAAKENMPDDQSKLEFSQGTGNALAVTGTYRSPGFNAQLDLQATLVARDGDLVVELAPDALNGLLPVLRSQVRTLLEQASKLPSLPFGFQAQEVRVNSTGVTVSATSSSLVLRGK